MLNSTARKAKIGKTFDTDIGRQKAARVKRITIVKIIVVTISLCNNVLNFVMDNWMAILGM